MHLFGKFLLWNEISTVAFELGKHVCTQLSRQQMSSHFAELFAICVDTSSLVAN